MSDFLSFLSNGQAPLSVPTYSQTSSQLPPWYNDYTQQILNRTAQYAAEPYTPYSGPRVASPSPLTDMAATQLTGMFTPSQNFYSAASQLAPSTGTSVGTSMPTSLTGDGGGTMYTGGTPNFNEAGGAPGGALPGAAPYMGITGGGFPANAQRYMSPYISNVVDEMSRLSNRNLKETLLPALQDEFIRTGGGGYGLNTREGDMAVRLGRDVAADLLGQQYGALNQGYQTAADIYNRDWANQIQGISSLNTLGTQYQGNTQANLDQAYKDFLTQRDWPLQQATNMRDMLSGLRIPDATVKYDYGPATNYSSSPLEQVGQLGLTWAGLNKLGQTGSTDTTGALTSLLGGSNTSNTSNTGWLSNPALYNLFLNTGGTSGSTGSSLDSIWNDPNLFNVNYQQPNVSGSGVDINDPNLYNLFYGWKP